MTSPMAQGIDDLNALLEERARYERWLAQLTGRREQTPPHVFERVRSDYARRLATVMEQILSRAEGVQATFTALHERVSALTAEETERRDARAEIELRAMVGEYSTDQADAELRVCDQEIGRLEAERTEATGELARVQEILVQVRQPGEKPAATPAPASRPLGAPPTGPENEAAFEELAFLHSVVDRPDAAPPPAPRAAEQAPSTTSPGSQKRSGVQQAVRDASPRVGAGTPAATPAFLRDMPTEQVKTLKCQECGTMNYPTEWYCERCGGELAAM